MIVRSSRQTSWLARGLFVLVLAISLYLRLNDLGAFMTIDEWSWRQRSIAFRSALLEEKLASTYQSEHPGVVDMWIGSAAEILEWHLGPIGSSQDDGGQGIPGLTLWARRMIATITWLGILGMYLLMRRLWGERAAMAGAVLVALDPFYLAHSRFHHLDGLVTTFAMISILAMLNYAKGKRIGFLALSAVAAALGMVTKISGLVVVPWAVAALYVLGDGGAEGSWLLRAWRKVRPAVPWGLVILAAVFAVWPALWVNPIGTLQKMAAGGAEQVLNPHVFWNYFWHQIRPDPGPGFYPVAWAFRTTPWVMLGILALVVIRRKGQRADAQLWTLAIWAVGFAVAMTLSPKKFDRYLLPIFPAVDILAAFGLLRLWERLREWRPLMGLRRVPVPAIGGAIIAATTCALIWPAMPYGTAYFNPLVGGTEKAPEILLIGWGECLDQVGAYLDSLPNAEDMVVAAQGNNELSPYTRSKVVYVDQLPIVEPDYYVLFISNVQRQFVFDIYSYFYGREEPAFVAGANGLEYAWVYPNTMYHDELETLMDEIMAGEDAEPTIVFNADASFARQYEGEAEMAVISASARRDYVQTELQAATEGKKGVWLVHFPDIYPEIYDSLAAELGGVGEPGARVTAGDLEATYYALPEGVRFVAAEPQVATDYVLGDTFHLTGYDLSVEELGPGVQADLRLYWEAEQEADRNWKVFLHVLGPDGTIYAQADAEPQGFSRPTQTWRAGEVVPDDYQFEIAADAPEGVYTVIIGMYDGETMERLPVTIGVGGKASGDQITLIEK